MMRNFDNYFMTENEIREKAEYLQSIVNGRNIAILLPGSSIEELSEKIDKFKDYDFCYFGLNTFDILEEHILGKIKKKFSVIQLSASVEIERLPKIFEFLDRQEDNLYATDVRFLQMALKEKIDSFIDKYEKKILTIFFTNDVHPNYLFQFPPSTNTLTSLLCLAVASKPSRIILFGADGGWLKGEESAIDSYFRGNTYSEDYKKTRVTLSHDTERFNKIIPYLLQDWYKFCNMKPIDIINCSINSKYDIFPKCTYDELLKILSKGI